MLQFFVHISGIDMHQYLMYNNSVRRKEDARKPAGYSPARGTKSGGKVRRDDGDRSGSNYPTKPPDTSLSSSRRGSLKKQTAHNTEGEKTMKYNLAGIMLAAWRNYRKGGISFGEALHRAWLSAKAEPINTARIKEAKKQAGILEDAKTWSDWKKAGYEVIHGSKALFGVDLIWGSKGDGATYKARFFGASQVQAMA